MMKYKLLAAICGILTVGAGVSRILSVQSTADNAPDYTVQDVKYLQNYLLCRETPELIGADYDLNDDGVLNVFDLVLMKQLLLQEYTGNSVVPVGGSLGFGFFTGQAWGQFFRTDTSFHLPSYSLVTFEPGARNDWHSHAGGQILIVTGGEGYYQEEGKPAQLLHEGDVVEIAPDVKHWHGASPGSWFAHIAIETNSEMGGFSLYEKLTDEAYQNLEVENPADKAVYPVGEPLTEDVWSLDIQIDELYHTPEMSYLTLAKNTEWELSDTLCCIVTSGKGMISGETVIETGDIFYTSADEVKTISSDKDSGLCVLLISPNE